MSIISNPQLKTLYDYWLGKKAGRAVPLRADIDPAELPATVLPHLMILELSRDDGALQIRFRLTGTDFDQALGRNPTGEVVSDKLHSNGDYVRYLHDLYGELQRNGKPLYSENLFYLARQAAPVRTLRLSLPLSSDGQLIDMAITGAIFERPTHTDPNYATTLVRFEEVRRHVLAS